MLAPGARLVTSEVFGQETTKAKNLGVTMVETTKIFEASGFGVKWLH